MPLIVKGNNYELPPEGQHVARCCDVFHAGWWPNMNGGADVEKVKLVFVFEDEAGKPHYADIFESATIGAKSNLRKYLKGWRGRDFTPEELDAFDLESVHGVPALITIEHEQKSDKTKAKIISIAKVPKQMQAFVPAIPEDYVPDAEREEPMARQYPPGSGGKKVSGARPVAYAAAAPAAKKDRWKAPAPASAGADAGDDDPFADADDERD